MHKYRICAFVAVIFGIIASSANNKNTTYTTPAKGVDSAVQIGNGTSGITIYGTFPDENILLNDIDITGEASVRKTGTSTDNPVATNKNTPLANIAIHHSVPVGSKVKSYERGLNLDSKTAFTNITLTEGLRGQELYASAPDSVIIIRYNEEVPLFCTIVLTSEFATQEVKSFDDQITLKGRIPGKTSDDEGTEFTTVLKVIPGEGNITTNPDASLTLNYMKGATLIITTVKSTPELKNMAIPADGDVAVNLARMRIFHAAFNLNGGLAQYSQAAENNTLPKNYIAESESSASNADNKFVNVTSVNEEGVTQVVLRTSPNHIEFLPSFQPNLVNGEAENLKALGSFDISFKWEKGKVTGGNITYIPQDYMPGETSVDLVLNGETHTVEISTGQTIPLENFIELVRPFIQ